MVAARIQYILRFFRQKIVGISRQKLVIFFFTSHFILAVTLGRMFIFAPDEERYLHTFNNVYTLPINTDAQKGSGWIAAPTLFLWIAYLPAKFINMIGVPDYLSIRLLSIMITTLSLFLLLKMDKNIRKDRRISQKVIFFFFFIPSIFLWTSTGLREAFIIFEITLFLVGVNYVFLKRQRIGVAFLFFGSYGLLSTKSYIWVLLIITLLTFIVFSLLLKNRKEDLMKLVVAGFITPLCFFAATTSQYALNFIVNTNISDVSSRSGETETQIDGFTFQDGYTLAALHSYLIENQDSLFTKVFEVTNLDETVENLWNKKIQEELKSDSSQVKKVITTLNGNTLKPGLITEPWTMLWPAFLFIAGPFPFVGGDGIAATIASFESPLWWLLYTLVIFQFYRFRRSKLFRDPAILFTLIFLAGEIAFSSLVEVNLGTSFRHRSILLVPLVFLYVRITQRVHELPDSDSKQTA